MADYSITAFADELEKIAGVVGNERMLYGGLGGAVLGAIAGGLLDENKVRGVIAGALGGGALGTGAGALYNKVNPVRLGRPSIHSQPLDNKSPQVLKRGMGHGPDEASKIMRQGSEVSVHGKDIVGDSKGFTDSVRRKGHDAVVTVYPKELDSVGRYSPADVHYPGGAEQDPKRLMAAARRYAAKVEKDKMF